MELAQVLLHSRRLELKRTDGISVAIELIGQRVVDVYFIDVQIFAGTYLYILDRLLDNRKGLQTEEVHLYKSCLFDDASFILGAQKFLTCLLVFRRRNRHPVANGVTANNCAAGVNTCVADI